MAESEGNGGSGYSLPASVQKVKKPKPPYNLGTQIRSALRLVWRRHPTLQQVLRRERIERNLIRKDGSTGALRVFYKCASCGNEFKMTEIQIDHVTPVGPTPGSKLAESRLTWDMFIAKLFCSPDNLKTVCKPCHKIKTDLETKKRWEGYNNVG